MYFNTAMAPAMTGGSGVTIRRCASPKYIDVRGADYQRDVSRPRLHSKRGRAARSFILPLVKGRAAEIGDPPPRSRNMDGRTRRSISDMAISPIGIASCGFSEVNVWGVAVT